MIMIMLIIGVDDGDDDDGDVDDGDKDNMKIMMIMMKLTQEMS